MTMAMRLAAHREIESAQKAALKRHKEFMETLAAIESYIMEVGTEEVKASLIEWKKSRQ